VPQPHQGRGSILPEAVEADPTAIKFLDLDGAKACHSAPGWRGIRGVGEAQELLLARLIDDGFDGPPVGLMRSRRWGRLFP
jgi:hypothetical protein